MRGKTRQRVASITVGLGDLSGLADFEDLENLLAVDTGDSVGMGFEHPEMDTVGTGNIVEPAD